MHAQSWLGRSEQLGAVLCVNGSALCVSFPARPSFPLLHVEVLMDLNIYLWLILF